MNAKEVIGKAISLGSYLTANDYSERIRPKLRQTLEDAEGKGIAAHLVADFKYIWMNSQ